MTVRKSMRNAELASIRPLFASLWRELGVLGTARVVGDVVRAKAQREPFAKFGPPVDERDELSRKQCGDVILIDRAVSRVAGGDVALRIAREAVTAGGIRFLDDMIPPLPTSGLGEFAKQVASRFFNAEADTRADEDDQAFHMTVTRCRFVELLAAANASHLAPLFCEVDSVYFGRAGQPIKLGRTQTLATGGTCCDFRFERV